GPRAGQAAHRGARRLGRGRVDGRAGRDVHDSFAAGGLRMTRILVVEDDPSIRLGLEDTLTAKGYEVDVVGKGSDGAERALTGRYDLVVLDVMLPDIDGFEVCRRIRSSRGPERRVPVIMLSARGAELDRVRGLELGADDYVTKPFSLMELLARVASVLRRAGGDDAAEPVGLVF